MLDIILEESRILLNFNPAFFDDKFKERWKKRENVQIAYQKYGKLTMEEPFLGFDKCFKRIAEDKIISYEWPFPEQKEREDRAGIFYVDMHEIEKFLVSLYTLFGYEINGRFGNPKTASEQSIFIDLTCRYQSSEGRPGLGGAIYPPLLDFFKNCDEETAEALCKYVKKEMSRMNLYIYGTENNFFRVKIQEDGFYLNTGQDGSVWSINEGTDYYNRQKIADHNIFGPGQQFILVVGMIALNTFYRKQVKND